MIFQEGGNLRTKEVKYGTCALKFSLTSLSLRIKPWAGKGIVIASLARGWQGQKRLPRRPLISKQ